MTIRAKLIAAFLAVSLVPTCLLGIFMVNQVLKRERSFFDESSRRQLEQVSNSFTLVLNGVAENLKALVEYEQVKNADATLPSYLTVPEISDLKSPTDGTAGALFSLLRQNGNAHPAYSYVYLGTDQGNYLQWPATKAKVNYDPRKRGWYKRAIDHPGQLGRINAYHFEEDDAALVSTGLTFTTKAGSQGVAGIDVSLKELTQAVKRVTFGTTGYVMIVEDSGNIIADPRHPENNLKPITSLGGGYRELANVSSGSLEIKLGDVPYTVSVFSSPELGWKFVGLIESSELLDGAREVAAAIATVSAIIILVCGLVGYLFTRSIVIPMQEASLRLQDIAAGGGDLTQRLDDARKDEVGSLAKSFNIFTGSIQRIIQEVRESSGSIEVNASDIAFQAQALNSASNRQVSAVHQLSTSFNQMVATASDVAVNCSKAAESAQAGEAQVISGQQVIAQMVSEVEGVEKFISLAANSIGELEQDVKSIDEILSNIRGIAEQTNLLALNAAIEAARAGEQGRGFAVVADEVRALAKRTTDSTGQVNSLLNGLVGSTKRVAGNMQHSLEKARGSAACVAEVSGAFTSIQSAVTIIKDMNIQIAAAAEEQHQVAEDINHHILTINNDAGEVTQGTEDTQRSTLVLKGASTELSTLVRRFKID